MKETHPSTGVRRRVLPKVLVVLALAAAAAVMGGSAAAEHSSAGSSSATPIHGGTLRFARNLEVQSFDPLKGGENGSLWTNVQIFDQLAEVLPGNPNPQPGLASSWTVSKDALHYTFNLRKARFSDGSPVTAADVKFCLDRMADPKQNLGFITLFQNIKNTQIVSPSAVRVNLSKVTPALIYSLTAPFASIYSKKAFTKLGATGFASHPLGSGPFKLQRWVKGSEVDLVRNPYYWRTGKPYLDAVHMLTVADDNARILKIKSGGADVAESIPFSQIDSLSKSAGITVRSDPFVASSVIILNQDHKPLDNLAVRQALNYATPKAAIRKAVYNNRVAIANNVNPPTKYDDPSIRPYPDDIAKAKSLLASAGVTSLNLTMVIIGTDAPSVQTATILQAAWAQAGVTLTIKPEDVGTFFSDAPNEDTNLLPWIVNSSDVTVDDEFALFTYDHQPMQWGHGTNLLLKQLADKATTTQSEAARTKLFHQLQQAAMNYAMVVPLVDASQETAVTSKVHGFSALPAGWWRLDQVWLSH